MACDSFSILRHHYSFIISIISQSWKGSWAHVRCQTKGRWSRRSLGFWFIDTCRINRLIWHLCNKQSHYLGRNRCRPSSLSLSDEFILQAGNFSYQQNKLQGLCSRVPEMLWQSLECKWVSRRVPRYLESPPDLSSLLTVLKGGDELARCKGRKEILCLLKWGEVFFSRVGYHFIKYQYL